MTDEIRPLRKGEEWQDAYLSEFAFQYEQSDEERAARVKDVNPDTILGYFVDGQLAAKAIILPLHIYIGGKSFAMGGVAGVATWPEHRRGGKVAALLRQALIDMRARGQSVSMLHPFSFAFYRRYGYELAFERKQMELKVTQLPRYSIEGMTVARTTERTRLAPIYDAYARRFNGMLARDDNWWDTRIGRRVRVQMAVCIDQTGCDRGYLIYHVKEEVFTALEFVFLDETARQALWTFIANHDSMAHTYKLLAPVCDALPFLLADPRIKQEIIPYFMARIVDVQAFLTAYPFATAGNAAPALSVTVRDDHAPWNNGTFPTEAGDSHTASVSCDIQTLTAMLFGYARPLQLHSHGRLAGTDEALAAWEAAIPRTQPFLLDFF